MRIKYTDMADVPPRVLVVERMDDGSFVGEVMPTFNVGNPFCWQGAVESATAYIQPTQKQLEKIIECLERGKLSMHEMDGMGSEFGGYTRIDC